MRNGTLNSRRGYLRISTVGRLGLLRLSWRRRHGGQRQVMIVVLVVLVVTTVLDSLKQRHERVLVDFVASKCIL